LLLCCGYGHDAKGYMLFDGKRGFADENQLINILVRP
jgi:hypothetical protein